MRGELRNLAAAAAGAGAAKGFLEALLAVGVLHDAGGDGGRRAGCADRPGRVSATGGFTNSTHDLLIVLTTH